MKLELLDLTICATGALALGMVLWYTTVVPMTRKEKHLVTVTPSVTVKEEVKHVTNEELLSYHNNPARVAEYVKMCTMKNRKILVGDYMKYCINVGETITVA